MPIFAAITSILVVVLFVLTVVFYFQAQAARRDLNDLNTNMAEFVRAEERQRDDVRQLVQAAGREQSSLVGYLVDTRREVMRRVTGVPTDGLADLGRKLDAVEGASDSPLLQVARSALGEVEALAGQLEQTEAALARAQEDLRNEVERVASIEQTAQQTAGGLREEVGQYRAEVEQLREEYNQARLAMDRRVDDIRRRADDRISILNSQLDETRAELRQAEQQVRELRGAGRSMGITPRPEASLVDGSIVAVDELDRRVTINRGARDKVVLGLTFTVYGSARDITPNEQGEYPQGKAMIEVIRVEENRSIARITSVTAGRPIIRGDVVANAVYDPDKVYKFVVFGNFDADGDGVESPQEADAVEAAVRGWNGIVVDRLAGDVDFLVLGSRPGLPPEPDITAPPEEVRQYQQQLAEVERYDELFRDAMSVGLPVLNQNRLYTLIGKPLGDIR